MERRLSYNNPMGENKLKIILPIVVAVALAVGSLAGYFYGNTVGKKVGREELLAEQKVTAEVAIQETQKKIAEEANPFNETVNPFKSGYTNPFGQ